MTQSSSVPLVVMTYNGVLCPSQGTSTAMAPRQGYLTRLNLLPADVSLHENRIFSGTPDPLKDQLQQLTDACPQHTPALPPSPVSLQAAP